LSIRIAIRGLGALALLAALLMASAVQAEIKPHALFSDHVVLRTRDKIPVWGTTDSNEKISVTLAGHTVSILPADGNWRVDLVGAKVGGPYEMLIEQAGSSVRIRDVLIGEVWLCAGESLATSVRQSEGAEEAISEADNPEIRFFTVARLKDRGEASDVSGRWQVCSRQSVADVSAVAYYFGRDLQKARGVPIGLINLNVADTPIEQWMSATAIASTLGATGQATVRPQSELYNTMIAPLTAFRIRGVIWCQGKSNTARAFQYRDLLPALINDWREAWKSEDLHFSIVQLAAYGEPEKEPRESQAAELREAQLLTNRTVPFTGLAVTADLGDANVHPAKSAEIGSRLTQIARVMSYREQLESSGPLYEKLLIRGDTIVLRFQHAGTGLVANGGKLAGFTIAGVDRKFYPAEAKIKNDTVIVHSDKVPQPVAVRYGWATWPVVNLFNQGGLPAIPFRTDAFLLTTQDKN